MSLVWMAALACLVLGAVERAPAGSPSLVIAAAILFVGGLDAICRFFEMSRRPGWDPRVVDTACAASLMLGLACGAAVKASLSGG